MVADSVGTTVYCLAGPKVVSLGAHWAARWVCYSADLTAGTWAWRMAAWKAATTAGERAGRRDD